MLCKRICQDKNEAEFFANMIYVNIKYKTGSSKLGKANWPGRETVNPGVWTLFLWGLCHEEGHIWEHRLWKAEGLEGEPAVKKQNSVE